MSKKQNSAPRSGSAKGKSDVKDPFAAFGFDPHNLIEDSQKSLMDNSMQLSERDLHEMLKGALEDVDVDRMQFNEDDLNDPELLAQLTGLEEDDGSARSAGLDKAPADSRAEYLRQRIAVEKKHCLEVRAAGQLDEARLFLSEIKRLEQQLHEHEQRGRTPGTTETVQARGSMHTAMDDLHESLAFDTRQISPTPSTRHVSAKAQEEADQFDQLGSMMDLEPSHTMTQSVPITSQVSHVDVMQQSPPLTRVKLEPPLEESQLDKSMRDSAHDDEPQTDVDQQLIALLHARSIEYKSFAAKFNKAGNKTAAMKYLKVGKTLEVMQQRASRGEHVDPTKIPPSAKELSAPSPQDALSASVPVSRATPTRTSPAHLTASVAPTSVVSVPKERSPKAKVSPARPQLSGSGVGDLDEELTVPHGTALADDPFASHNPPRIEGESDDEYKRRRVFETIEGLLTAQIQKALNNALKYKNSGNKQEALKYLKEKKDLTADLQQVTRAKQFPHVPPPVYKLDTIERREEIVNPEVRMDELEFQIVRAFDILPPSGYDTLDLYFYCEFPYPQNQVQKLRSNTVKRSIEPEFNYAGRVKIERKNVFARFLKSRKVTFELYHQRSFLLRDIKLGQAELKLQDLLNQSTVHEFIDITEGKKNVIGKLEIKARLREPLLAKQIRVTREQILRVEKHYPITSPPVTQPSNTNVRTPSKTTTPDAATTPVASTSPVTATPVPDITVERPSEDQSENPEEHSQSGPTSMEGVSQPVTPVEPVTPMPVTPVEQVTPVTDSHAAQPSETSAEIPADWDSVDRIDSNAVLEYEQQKIETQMVLLKRSKKEIPEELQLRLSQVQMKMQILIIKIQKEILTMESYTELIRQKIKEDRELALKFKRAGMIEQAKEMLKRVTLMEKEMANDE